MGIHANTVRVLTGRARATLRAAEEASTRSTNASSWSGRFGRSSERSLPSPT